jgi:hypothetical protein
MIALLLMILATHLVLGAFFASWFCLRGARRIDPHAGTGSWGFRVLIFPGAMALWPLLFSRVVRGANHPPTERTPHRIAAGEIPPMP